MSGVELHPVEGAGVEVVCPDLTELTDAEFEQIEAAFRDHGLLYFREHYVTDAWFAEFAQRWGTLRDDPEVPSHHGLPRLGVVHRSSDDSEIHGGRWHSDRSFEPVPPAATLLIARELPLGGGATRFANLYDAYDALDSATRRHLEGLSALHRSPEGNAAQLHPLVIRHPISGRAVLYANPTFTTDIAGIEPAESLALLNQLFAHCTSPEFCHTFEWDPGSMVLWDNRAVLHLAVDDYPGQTRTMHRALVGGVKLVQAASAGSPADPTLAQRAGTTVAGAVVTAAMLGLGHVIEPEKARPDIEITADAPEPEPLDTLDFGSLPPLD